MPTIIWTYRSSLRLYATYLACTRIRALVRRFTSGSAVLPGLYVTPQLTRVPALRMPRMIRWTYRFNFANTPLYGCTGQVQFS